MRGTELQDTTQHSAMARITDLLAQLEAEIAALPLAIAALPLASGEAHSHLQGAFWRFKASFNSIEPIREGRAVILVGGLQRYVEVSNDNIV